MGAKEDREAWTKKYTHDEMQRSIDRVAGKSKYGAIRTEAGGRVFASKREASRYMDLALMQAAKQISGLEIQPQYELYVTPPDSVARVTFGVYTADFRYWQDGKQVIEDVKSKATRTQAYRLRKKITEALYGITITEV